MVTSLVIFNPASSGDEPLETETRSHRAKERRMERSLKMESATDERDCGNESTPVISSIKRARLDQEVGEEESDGESGSFSEEGAGEGDEEEKEGEEGEGEGEEREGEEGEGEEGEGEGDGYIDDSEESGEDSELSSAGGGEDEEEEEEGEEREGQEERESKAHYVPPHMRGNPRSSRAIEKLQRNLQGLVNR